MASPTLALADAASIEFLRVECAGDGNQRYLEVTVREGPGSLGLGRKTSVLVRAETSIGYLPADDTVPFVNGTSRHRIHVPYSVTYEVLVVSLNGVGAELVGQRVEMRKSFQDWSLDTKLPDGTIALNQQVVKGCPPPIIAPSPDGQKP